MSLPKQLISPVVALCILWGLCFLVAVTGGLPEPLGTFVGQNLSRTGHTLFLTFGISWILLSPLAPNETRWMRVGMLAAALLFYGAIYLMFKHLFYWPRPGQPSISTPGHRGSGFPSGHTLPAFEIACLVAAISPRLSKPALFMAVLIGYSRVEVTAHYPYQVVFSGILGVIAGVGIWSWRAKSLSASALQGLAPSTSS